MSNSVLAMRPIQRSSPPAASQHMRRRSLTTRLTLSHVLVTLAGIVVLAVALLLLVRQREITQNEARLADQAAFYAGYAAMLLERFKLAALCFDAFAEGKHRDHVTDLATRARFRPDPRREARGRRRDTRRVGLVGE